MPRDVRTRWNSTYEMMEFALTYQKVIDDLTSERDLGLRAYEMDPNEWVIAKQLCEILKVCAICIRSLNQYLTTRLQMFNDATHFFSRHKISNLTTVIPAMDRLDECLTNAMISSKYSPAIRAAIRMGKQTLNRYYSKTDYSELYRIAMGKSHLLQQRHS